MSVNLHPTFENSDNRLHAGTISSPFHSLVIKNALGWIFHKNDTMSSSGTATVSPQEPQVFKRAVRKIKCAAMVANLAKSWQGWANEHTGKQDAIPSGWMPSSVEEEDKKEHVVKLAVKPRVITADADGDGNRIRSVTVNKTIQPKRSECSGSDLVNAIRGKMESGGAEESKPFLGNESPTRRRHLRALQSKGGDGGVIHDRKLLLQDKKFGSRSSSVDTEDSGLGEDMALSDNSESRPEQSDGKKPANKPKVESSLHQTMNRCPTEVGSHISDEQVAIVRQTGKDNLKNDYNRTTIEAANKLLYLFII